MPRICRTLAACLLALAWLAPAPSPARDLLAVYQLAAQNDQSYQAAKAAYEASRLARPLALAPLLPSLAVSGHGGLNTFNPLDPAEEGVGNSPQDYDTQKLSLSLRQVVFDYAKLTQARQSNVRVSQAKAEFMSEGQDLIMRVAQRYFQVLEAAESLEFVRAEKRALAQGLERAKRSAEAGLISGTESYLAQARYELVRAQEIAAANHLAASKEELAELTGQPVESLADLPLDIPLALPKPADPEHWTKRALTANLNVVALARAMRGAELQISRERAGHLPTLSLVASHGYSDVGGGRVSGTDLSSSVGLEVSVPIFDGWLASTQTKQAHYLYKQAKAKYLAEKRKVARTVKNAYREIVVSAAHIAALKLAVASSNQATEGASQRVQVGAASFVDLLEALRDNFKAKSDLAQARYKYLLARLRLYQAVGALGPQNLASINSLLKPAAPKPAN